MQPSKKQLHPELSRFVCDGGLFDVDPTELDLGIGRECVFISPTCPAEKDTFIVQSTQRLHDGSIGYRVVPNDNMEAFGRPARLSEIRFLD